MSYSPNDLTTDLDLLAYEAGILSSFGKTDWRAKRTKALQDWLWPQLRGQGFNPTRFRTRYEPDVVASFISPTYADVTGAATNVTADDLNLATVFATVGTDALYVGSSQPFRGLSLRMLAGVTATANVASVAYWNDAWTSLVVTDGTQSTSGVSFSKGGAISWATPDDWVVRPVSTFDRLYWVKVTTTATPSSATAGQVGVIRASLLTAPVTLWTLALIMLEAPTSGSGPWAEKRKEYERLAQDALQRALPSLGGEFETDDPPTDQISEDEADQTTEEATGGPWRLERA
jgi:hypothetical protein